MSSPGSRAYPPMTPRHKRVFAVAGLLAVAVAGGLAFARLQLIRWWLGHCTQAAAADCRTAELAFEWWWIPLLVAIGAIALTAHWVTRDRLTPPP